MSSKENETHLPKPEESKTEETPPPQKTATQEPERKFVCGCSDKCVYKDLTCLKRHITRVHDKVVPAGTTPSEVYKNQPPQ